MPQEDIEKYDFFEKTNGIFLFFIFSIVNIP